MDVLQAAVWLNFGPVTLPCFNPFYHGALCLMPCKSAQTAPWEVNNSMTWGKPENTLSSVHFQAPNIKDICLSFLGLQIKYNSPYRLAALNHMCSHAFKLYVGSQQKGSSAPATSLQNTTQHNTTQLWTDCMVNGVKIKRIASFISPWLGKKCHAGTPLRCAEAPSSPPHRPPGCTCSSRASRSPTDDTVNNV